MKQGLIIYGNEDEQECRESFFSFLIVTSKKEYGTMITIIIIEVKIMNYKQSKQRQKILKLIQSEREHVNADQIYNKLKLEDSTIGIATVYRNLNLLCEWDLIRKITSNKDGILYDGVTEKHYHFHCKDCNELYDVPYSYIHKLDESIAKEMGCVVDRHNLIFEGVCKNCIGIQHKKN